MNNDEIQKTAGAVFTIGAMMVFGGIAILCGCLLLALAGA